MVTNYVSGTSWYRKWSDGWIEQGGRVTASSVDTHYAVTLITPFSNSNYYINLTSNSTTTTFNATQPNWVDSRNSTVFGAHIDAYTGTPDWYACGY